MTTTLVDAAARKRIATETGSNLFVEAGAGSGKTHALVDRVCRLVLHDGVRLPQIAAVTFTEKAGAELRDRLRAKFEKEYTATADGSTDPDDPAHGGEEPMRRQRAADALDDLDSAAIGTLHSFAQRILTAYPIQAGLPPLVEVLDEVASSVAFEERWVLMRRELLDYDDLAPTVQLALAGGVKLDHLRSLTRALNNDWDLIEDRIPPGTPSSVVMPSAAELIDTASRLAARASECQDPADRFVARLAALGAWSKRASGATTDVELYAALLAAADLSFSYGQKKAWAGALDDLRTQCKALQEQAAALAAQVTEAVLRPLTQWLAHQVLASAQARAAEGTLEFHDLLVLARRLVRGDGPDDPDSAEVRAELRERYQVLLLDEFQDTDPIQIELAVRITAGVDGGAADWRDLLVPPGSLFVVGDPKQSIYRFRRASIETYLGAQDWFSAPALEQLRTNFRTVPDVLRWVNDVFSSVITFQPGAQPGYEPLGAFRDPVDGGPAVTVLGADEHDFKAHGNAEELRRKEAADVAAAIRTVMRDSWQVKAGDAVRATKLGDIALLIPSRTSLPALEAALDEARIPYRTESSSLVYQSPEVHHLLVAARVIADPGDYFSCVVALRSPLFGCGDDDLWTWEQARGNFNALAPTGDILAELGTQDHPVAAALDYLRRLHYRARWMTPSEVLGALVSDRRVYEVAGGRPRRLDHWRRIRFVIDQARAWSETEHGGLRGYLAWAAKQGEESSRVAEAVLPETDVDAVRIMTVHAAKGLEFPVVILSGMTAQPQNRRGVQLLWPRDGGYAVHFTKRIQSNDFEDAQTAEEQMDTQERRRLLYVAATRARDHLIVSLHRGQGGPETNARILADAGAADAGGAARFNADEILGEPEPAPASSAPEPPPEWEAWQEQMDDVRRRSLHQPAHSASGLEGTEPEIALEDVTVVLAGDAKGGRDAELAPWVKGRYGSAIGRAVHGVLQVIDLATGAGLDQAVASQSIAEGVTQHADLVRTLVENALASEVVRRAAERDHWRETFVGMQQDDGTILEGFVDLIYREDDGSLVVVDFKTDDIPSDAVPARAAFYEPQLHAYQTVIETAAGARTVGQLIFLSATAEDHQTARART